MSKLVDPTICPDCRATLLADGTCPGCGLRLAGPLAVELWQAMQHADSLVERLRAAGQPVAAPVPAVRTPVPPAATPGRRPSRLPSASVPMVLLALGGLCLLVSAVVFVAVTWSDLGIGARTAILALVTSFVATGAAAVTRRGLRWAAETLWVVTSGMLALDVLGARSAGLLGLDQLAGRHVTALLGLLELALGVAVATWSRNRPTGRLVAPQVVAAGGLLMLTSAEAWAAGRTAVALSVAVPVLAGVAFLARRVVPLTGIGAGVLASVSWLLLVGDGLGRLASSPGDRVWWSQLEGWPLLVAAALVAGAAQAGNLDEVLGRADASLAALARPAAAAAALGCVALVVEGPLGDPTVDLLVGAAVVAALGALARILPAVWARGSAALAGTGGVVLALWLLGRAWALLELLPADGHEAIDARLPLLTDGPAPWTAIPVAAAVLTACWGAASVLPAAARSMLLDGVVPGVAPALAGLAVATTTLTAGAPLGVAALAFLVALAAAAAAVAWQQGKPLVELATLVAFALVVAPALRLALASTLLTAVLATLLAVVLAVGHRLLRPAWLWSAGTTLLAVAAVLGGALAVASWADLADASVATRAFALAGYSAAVGLTVRFLALDRAGRGLVELVALLVGLGAVALAPTAGTAGLVATVVGSAVCLVAVLDGDRTWVGWVGAAVLGAATVLRVAADVRAPEVVSLPAAALLLAAGGWRMGRSAGASSFRALGSGLALALLPSLLLALDEPVSLRGALVGMAAIAALAVGVALHWAAPFLAGAATTAVLAVRHLWPVAEALPRWITFGAVGLALLFVGITWEARRRDLAATTRYLRALR